MGERLSTKHQPLWSKMALWFLAQQGVRLRVKAWALCWVGQEPHLSDTWCINEFLHHM